MQRVSGSWKGSAACRDILQSASTSSWEASGAQQKLQHEQQQQQLDNDLTALLGELQQALPAQESRDAQQQPEAACVPQQSVTPPKQLAMVSLLHAMHSVGPQKVAVQQKHTPIPVLEDCPRVQAPSGGYKMSQSSFGSSSLGALGDEASS